MNDKIMREYEAYKKKIAKITKQVTEIYNMIWKKVLNKYYSDTFNPKMKKYYYIDKETAEAIKNDPYANMLLATMLENDGFEYRSVMTGSGDAWYITREKIDKIMTEYQEQKNSKSHS